MNWPGIVMLTVALSTVTAACGEANNRTQAAFERDVAAVCSDHVEQRSAAAAAHFTSETEPPTVAQLQAFYAEFAPTYRSFADELDKIEPPDGRADDYEQVLAAVRRNADTIEEAGEDAATAQHLLETDEAELRDADELAAPLGFPSDC